MSEDPPIATPRVPTKSHRRLEGLRVEIEIPTRPPLKEASMVVTTAALGILGVMATTGGARAKVRPERATTAGHTAAAVSGVRGEGKDGTGVKEGR